MFRESWASLVFVAIARCKLRDTTRSSSSVSGDDMAVAILKSTSDELRFVGFASSCFRRYFCRVRREEGDWCIAAHWKKVRQPSAAQVIASVTEVASKHCSSLFYDGTVATEIYIFCALIVEVTRHSKQNHEQLTTYHRNTLLRAVQHSKRYSSHCCASTQSFTV